MVRRSRPVPARGAPAREGPIRTCVGCRTAASAAELLRVVLVDGVLVPDTRRRLPGRGAWIHHSPDCLREAERRRAFRRALRIPRDAPAPDVQRLRDHLAAPRQASGTQAGETPPPEEQKQEAGRPVMSQP